MGRSSCGSARTSRFTCGNGKHHLQCGLVWKTGHRSAPREVLCRYPLMQLHAAPHARLAGPCKGRASAPAHGAASLTNHEISRYQRTDAGNSGQIKYWVFTSTCVIDSFQELACFFTCHYVVVEMWHVEGSRVQRQSKDRKVGFQNKSNDFLTLLDLLDQWLPCWRAQGTRLSEPVAGAGVTP